MSRSAAVLPILPIWSRMMPKQASFTAARQSETTSDSLFVVQIPISFHKWLLVHLGPFKTSKIKVTQCQQKSTIQARYEVRERGSRLYSHDLQRKHVQQPQLQQNKTQPTTGDWTGDTPQHEPVLNPGSDPLQPE